jgi:hypothetical protein
MAVIGHSARSRFVGLLEEHVIATIAMQAESDGRRPTCGYHDPLHRISVRFPEAPPTHNYTGTLFNSIPLARIFWFSSNQTEHGSSILATKCLSSASANMESASE